MTSSASVLDKVYHPLRDIVSPRGSYHHRKADHTHLKSGEAVISKFDQNTQSVTLSGAAISGSYSTTSESINGQKDPSNHEHSSLKSNEHRSSSSDTPQASTPQAQLSTAIVSPTKTMYPWSGSTSNTVSAASTSSRTSSLIASQTSSLPAEQNVPPPKNEEPNDNQEIIIEERRKQVLSDGTIDSTSYTIHRYIRGRLLGKGGFAKVYLCTAMDSKKQYAVKVVPKANLVKTRARQKLQTEIKIHRVLKHKFVCEFKHFFEDRENCYILLELCHNQSINELIKRRKRLTEPEAAYFMLQLLQAVEYLHSKLVIHRDLKLGNLFISKQLLIKVGDLGLATRVADKDEKRKTICGTPNYIAPEIIQNDKAKRGHSFEVDVWSMGVIMYTILIGKPPYEAKNVKATYQRILKNEYSFPSHVMISSIARDLIEQMLQSEPSNRPSLKQIAAHSFFASNYVPTCLPSSILHFSPKWKIVNDIIELVVTNENDQILPSTAQNAVDVSKHGLPRPSSGLLSSRLPFRSQDVNKNYQAESLLLSQKFATSTASLIDKKEEDERESLEAKNPPLKFEEKPLQSCGFTIFDESGTAKARPNQSSLPVDEAALVQKVKSVSLNSDKVPSSQGNSQQTHFTTTANYGSHTSLSSGSQASDFDVLNSMFHRLHSVLNVVRTKKNEYKVQLPKIILPSYGPRKWVIRYVDYTSKYGLGFLLNDGSSGVYFNDSTKIILDRKGESFVYIDRKRCDNELDGKVQELKSSTMPSSELTTFANYTLLSYPDFLKKKVILLKHFRNYLIDQCMEEMKSLSVADCSSIRNCSNQLVFVKKWIRAPNAILFRLSDQTVQVVFFDLSEILLTTDDRYITYVDKNRNRSTFPLNDELLGTMSDLESRVKVTKEILSELLQQQC